MIRLTNVLPRRTSLRRGGCLEHDDVPALRITEVVDEPVREHSVRESRLAPRRRARAVERRLHRRGRDAVGIDHPRLDREHDRDRADDRDDPVDGDPEPTRKSSGDAIERVVELLVLFRVGRRGGAAATKTGARGGGGDRYSLGIASRRASAAEALFGVAHAAPDVLSPPGVDPTVVAGEQNLRHRPAAELGRPRVVRVLQPAVQRGGEALDLAGALGERARKPPYDRVEERQRRDLASRQHVRADRDDVRAEVIEDPLVESLEPRRQQRENGLRCELLDELLVELPPLRGSATTRWSGKPPYTASSAAATTSTRSTIPGPPPYGSSST